MTIYILGTPEETAQALDDKSLKKMIKSIACVLCNAWHVTKSNSALSDSVKYEKIEIPIRCTEYKDFDDATQWRYWARDCRANYFYFVELGLVCCEEWRKRYDKLNRYQSIIEWTKDNVPNLPHHYADDLTLKSPFPYLMPKKYILQAINSVAPFRIAIQQDYEVSPAINAYRNYYTAKIKHYKIIEDEDDRGKFMRTIQVKALPVWTGREKPEWLAYYI